MFKTFVSLLSGHASYNRNAETHCEEWVLFQTNFCGICGGQCSTAVDFSPHHSIFPVTIIPPKSHIYISLTF